MTSNKNQETKNRMQILTELRKIHQEKVGEAQELLKKQQSIRKSLRNALKTEARTIPQLAEETGIPSHEVLWHVATMKKYGLITETEIDEAEEYYLYKLPEESR